MRALSSSKNKKIRNEHNLFRKKKSEMQRRQKNNESVKERNVTGRFGSCIQKEQFTLNFLKKQTKIIYIIIL